VETFAGDFMNEAVCNQKMHYKEFSLDGCDEVKSFGQ